MHAELERQHAELDRIRAVLAGLTAEAATSEGDVSVTVNARGLLVGLTIDPAALRDRDAAGRLGGGDHLTRPPTKSCALHAD